MFANQLLSLAALAVSIWSPSVSAAFVKRSSCADGKNSAVNRECLSSYPVTKSLTYIVPNDSGLLSILYSSRRSYGERL